MGFKLTPDSNSTKTSLDSPTTMPLALNLETLQCRFLSTIGPFPSNYIQISMQFMRQEINLKKLMQVSHVTSVSLGICLLVGFQLIRPLFVHIWILFLLVQIQIFFIHTDQRSIPLLQFSVYAQIDRNISNSPKHIFMNFCSE